MLSDLTDAFEYYEKTDNLGVISIEHFKNILTNFGFTKANKKEIDIEITKTYQEYSKATAVDFAFIKFVVAKHLHFPAARSNIFHTDRTVFTPFSAARGKNLPRNPFHMCKFRRKIQILFVTRSSEHS